MRLRPSGARPVPHSNNIGRHRTDIDAAQRRMQRELEQKASKPARLLKRLRACGIEVLRGEQRGDLLVRPVSLVTRRDAAEIERFRAELWALVGTETV